MVPDAEARIMSALHVMSQEQRAFEKRVMEELSDMKGEVLRLGGKVEGFEGSCRLRHKQVDAEMATMRTSVGALKEHDETTGRHELLDLKAELKRRDEERRKWLFWGITTATSLLLGGGGFGMLLAELFLK